MVIISERPIEFKLGKVKKVGDILNEEFSKDGIRVYKTWSRVEQIMTVLVDAAYYFPLAPTAESWRHDTREANLWQFSLKDWLLVTQNADLQTSKYLSLLW